MHTPDRRPLVRLFIRLLIAVADALRPELAGETTPAPRCGRPHRSTHSRSSRRVR